LAIAVKLCWKTLLFSLGGQLITEDAGLKLESTKWICWAKPSDYITKDNTTIVAEGNETVKARCEQIRRQMDETDSSYDKRSCKSV